MVRVCSSAVLVALLALVPGLLHALILTAVVPSLLSYDTTSNAIIPALVKIHRKLPTPYSSNIDISACAIS